MSGKLRATIVEKLSAGATPDMVSRARKLVDANDNIIIGLLTVGFTTDEVLAAAAEALGISVAEERWLRDPAPSATGVDRKLCREIGACPIGVSRGNLVIAYSNPEDAERRATLGFPPHEACVALRSRLDLALRRLDEAAFDETAPNAAAPPPVKPAAPAPAPDPLTEGTLELHVDPEPSLPRRRTSSPTPGVGRGGLQVTPAAAVPPPPPPSAPLPPKKSERVEKRPHAPVVAEAALERSPALDPALPSMSEAAALAAAAVRSMDAEPAARAASAATSSGPRWGLIAVGLVVLAGAGVGARTWWSREEAAKKPLPAVEVKAGAVDASAAQAALLVDARAAKDPTAQVNLLTKIVMLDPATTVARDALWDRARRYHELKLHERARRDLVKLQERADLGPLLPEVEALHATIVKEHGPGTDVAPATTPAPTPAPTPPPMPPPPTSTP